MGRRQRQPKNWVMPTRLATMASQAMARCNKCGSGLARDAPRGRRSISKALKIPRQALRDAPRGRRSIYASPKIPRQAPASQPLISRQTQPPPTFPYTKTTIPGYITPAPTTPVIAAAYCDRPEAMHYPYPLALSEPPARIDAFAAISLPRQPTLRPTSSLCASTASTRALQP